ncbi:8-amino-7-oxononanoate synthase [compost metagenome]
MLHQKIADYNEQMARSTLNRIYSKSCIQTVLFQSDEQAKQAAATLREKGFDVRPVLSPTVPEGRERLRICLHLYNTDEEIRNLTTALNELT